MNRKFGIEMEIVGITRETAVAALQAVNINAVSEDYNHVTRRHWKIVSDSSVRGGFEVVSPILYGEAGVAEAEIVARALDDAGATVNASCGLHVHFDAADLNVDAIKTILRRYAKFENEIDSFMPKSRRGNANRYCHSLNEHISAVDSANSINDLLRCYGSRYYKINLESISRHGTIEFRQHSGTVNAAKIVNWVRFLAAFIEQCKVMAENSAQPCELPELSGVQKKLAEMFQSQTAITLQRIMDEFGWLDISARAAVTRLRKAGMQIKATRLDGNAAYMFNGYENSGQTGNNRDSLWNGIEPDVTLFYQRRAAVLEVAA